MKIGLLSDTHSYIDDRILHHLSDCDQIWHAGDAGNNLVLEKLSATKETVGVYGNIDGTEIRFQWPEFVVKKLNGLTFLMIHIAGAVERYNAKTRDLIALHKPDVLICGHSHILKVVRDKRYNLIHMNPGAAGNHGFHKVRTLLKFDVENSNLANLQVIELGPKSTKTID